MNFQEIKKAIDEGLKVCHKSNKFPVFIDADGCYCINVLGQDYAIHNEKDELTYSEFDFFVDSYSIPKQEGTPRNLEFELEQILGLVKFCMYGQDDAKIKELMYAVEEFGVHSISHKIDITDSQIEFTNADGSSNEAFNEGIDIEEIIVEVFREKVQFHLIESTGGYLSTDFIPFHLYESDNEL